MIDIAVPIHFVLRIPARIISCLKPRADLRPLLNAFERHAAEEHYINCTRWTDIPFRTGTDDPAPMRGNEIVSEQERVAWRRYLKNLESECEKLGLETTRVALKEAFEMFSVGRLSRTAAYQAYNRVSNALKDEMVRSLR